MYRENNSVDELSSDDDGPSLCKERKLDIHDYTEENFKAGSKAARMWTDFLAEQSLSDTFSGKVGVFRGGNDVVERGVESYTLPDERLMVSNSAIHKERVISIHDYDCEPFDFVADEEQCERHHNKRDRKWSGRDERHFSEQKRKGKNSYKPSASKVQAPSNCVNMKQNKDDKKINVLKRKRMSHNAISLVHSEYSLETLMSVEFPEDLDISELAERIVDALGELNREFLKNVVIEVGEEIALRLFEGTREIEASGGMMTADKTRRRTPGGVFMNLFKTDPNVSPSLKVGFFRYWSGE
ncbi:unnamed protein product [Thelazia callipaeda]|uniref:Phosphorylated adapter RNA export protein n=1 Tax=Thelazia callipaeda TaxID=103827 RepID=A0A0N5D2X8_THECL|nr:unnamed protein product [Thelazia callipaeda]